MGFAQKILLSLSAFSAIGCSTTSERPNVDVRFWFGSPQKVAIIRQPIGSLPEKVACASPQFNHYIAMSKEDFVSFYKTFVAGCARWKKEGVELTPEEMDILNGALGKD